MAESGQLQVMVKVRTPEPRTQNPEPQTPNPKPQTPNPQPPTPNPELITVVGPLQVRVQAIALETRNPRRSAYPDSTRTPKAESRNLKLTFPPPLALIPGKLLVLHLLATSYCTNTV